MEQAKTYEVVYNPSVHLYRIWDHKKKDWFRVCGDYAPSPYYTGWKWIASLRVRGLIKEDRRYASVIPWAELEPKS